MPIAILDIDGTLVDSNYHHALAWHRALRSCGVIVPVWRIHRHIGMGGDQLVEALAGERVEDELGDRIRDAEKQAYGELIAEVLPLDNAHSLLVALNERDLPIILASSAPADEVEHYLDLIDARHLIEGYTSSDDVDDSKPEPDLIEAALEIGPGGEAIMLGDSVWDLKAAERAGVPSLAVLTGGFSQAELEASGAKRVFASLGEVIDALDQTPAPFGD